MKYTIVERNDRLDLINYVNYAISEGWLPIGGVAVMDDIRRRGCHIYMQSMIMHEPIDLTKGG